MEEKILSSEVAVQDVCGGLSDFRIRVRHLSNQDNFSIEVIPYFNIVETVIYLFSGLGNLFEAILRMSCQVGNDA